MNILLPILSLLLTIQVSALIPTISNVTQFKKLLQEPLQKFETHDPYSDLTIDEFVNVNGYALETYEVTTEDGYILKLHRIPHRIDENSSLSQNSAPKPVIVFKAGIQCSSWDFIYLGQQKSLGMLLADLGYDIWLINARGNRYSKDHIEFYSSYNSKEYWNFTFHEKGYYDLPASIDFILNQTSAKNVSLITFSLGASEALVFAITRPEYQEKINLFALLSPLVYWSNIKSPVYRLLYTFQQEIAMIQKLLHFEGLPYNFLSMNRPILKNLCSIESPLQPLCFALLEQDFWGPDYAQFNKSLLPLYLANYPAGNSIKEFLHVAQLIGSGKFRQYDYGIENLIRYHSIEPPEYDISSVKIPIAIYYGKNDYVATKMDVEKLVKQVANLVESKLVEDDLYNHVDFIWAMNAKTQIYDNVIEHVLKYNPIN